MTETQGDAEPRFSRILATVAASKYSIHDLSRSTGEGNENLARLNMPLALGMAAAFHFERDGSDRPHRWLALVPEGYAYQRFVSDLAGFDPARHDASVPSIIREVSVWLRTLDDVRASRVEQDRLYLGEQLWLQFSTYRAFLGRVATRIIMGKRRGHSGVRFLSLTTPQGV